MGAIELDANSLIQAESYLLKATQLAPGLLLSRRLLAVTYLRSGKPAKALEALNSGGGKDGINPILFSLAGEAYLQNGDPQTAEKYFVQALKIDPDNAGKRAALAVAHLATGKTATAIDELNAIASSDPGSSADFALISAHLQRNEFDKALVAIDRLEGKQPDKPMAPNLRGRVQMLQKDPVAARRSFERALAIEPSYFTAAASLAAMDLADKKPEDAKKRFQGLLAINPKDGQALTSLARLAALNGAPKDEVAELLSKAVAASPEEAVPRLLLIELLLRHRENKQALTMAQDAATALPNNPEILAALGRMHQVSGDVNQAISVYSKLISMQPSSPQPLIRLAEAYAANKDHGAAEQSLRKALEMQPDLLDAQRALIVLAIDAKKYQNAAKVVRTIQQQRPKDSLGFILQGDVASAQSDWGVAVSAYRTGMQMSASTELAIKLHSALVRSGNYAEGERFAIKWLKEQPSDSVFISQLAEFSIMRKEYSSAQVHYLSLLKLQPNNTVVLNNLAWVMGILKQDGAILYAEKANKLEPNQPILMDTLAVLLAEEKEYGRSIELLSKALEIQPTNAKIRLTLAKIYIKSGDKVKAKKELDSLSYLGEKFYLQPEVSAILKGL